MADSADFTVEGVPIPQGSKSGFVNKKTGGVIIVEGKGKGAVRHKQWRAQVAKEATEWAEANGHEPWDCAVLVRLRFAMPKPKSKPAWKTLPDVRPDIDKLTRSILDSLTGPIFKEDGRVVRMLVEKVYAIGEPPSVEIHVEPIHEGPLSLFGPEEDLTGDMV